MEEPTIRHVRFFNGQFLTQSEFREEQLYGNHMRRRLNYVLFTDGVAQIESPDLTIVREPETATGATPKLIRIKAGMALGGTRDIKETKEIILRRDSDPLNVSTVAGATTVWVTVNYLESEALPVLIGSTTENARVDEMVEIRMHATRPAAGTTAPNGEPLIILGSVIVATMQISPDDRQTARLRTALIAGEPGITLDPATVTAGNATFETTIRSVGGFDLSAVTIGQISFPSTTGLTLPATIVGAPTASSVRIRFGVLVTATGTRQIRVSPTGVPAEEATLTIQAFVPAPTATFPGTATRNTALTINGTNFIGTVSVNFAAGGGGTVSASATVNVAQTQLTVTVPGTAASGNISVTAQGGTTPPATIVIF